MNLAAILTIYLLSAGSPGPGRSAPEVRGAALQQPNKATTDPSTPQAIQSPPPAPTTTGSPSTTAAPAKPAQPTRRRKKKTAPCSTSPTVQDAAPGNAASATAGTAAKPCPPPKKVVKNGGSEEPSIQLVGGTDADQASQQRSTEQLTAATDENLKQIAGRQLTPSQQDMVNQVKQFMDQSKAAVAAGNPERGHNLAQKAHLLSEELLKP